MKEKISIEYSIYESISSIEPTQQELLQSAYNSSKNAYAPYSHFNVGAAILLEDQTIICGNNQENASYPCGICAERNAIHNVRANYPDFKIHSIAITTFRLLKQSIPATPCGLCRQVLSETEQNNGSVIELILGHPEGKVFIFNSCQSLLPLAFQSKNLFN
ncbi:MAG: cytidine deaminase [Saprospiraceae bacterium]|nr:cytidine deaminase [Saprospiraceae bacterium]